MSVSPFPGIKAASGHSLRSVVRTSSSLRSALMRVGYAIYSEPWESKRRYGRAVLSLHRKLACGFL
jgi:hypothetical protein